MSRILITTLGSLGDLHPKIAIGLELRRRGHDIVFVTHKVYQSKLEAKGFEFHQMRPDFTAMNDPQEMARMMDLKTGQEYLVCEWVNPNLSKMYSDLLKVARTSDFIFTGEGVVATPLVAEKLGMRWASSAICPMSFFSVYDPPVFPSFPFLAKLYPLGLPFNRAIKNFAKFTTNSWAEPIRQLRSELRLSPVEGNPLIDEKFSPYLVVGLFSSVLAQPQPDWPAHTIFAGFTFYDGSDTEKDLSAKLQQFLDAGDRPLVFTLGSTAVLSPGNFYYESIQAAQQLNRPAVLLIGKNPPPDNLPASIIAVDYAPFSLIFPRACAIIHHGGIGTTAQALRAGRPTLVMPYSHDQPDNAARLERLGTSRTVSRNNYKAGRIVKELKELLENPKYTAKATEISKIVRSENGVSTACDAIEQQLTLPQTRSPANLI